MSNKLKSRRRSYYSSGSSIIEAYDEYGNSVNCMQIVNHFKKVKIKKTLICSLSFFVVLLVFISCSTKLNVNAEWKDIMVVTGLLNQADSIQYIRIGKAFLGPGDELQYARIPDSSNYTANLEVRLNEFRDDTSLIRSVILRDTTITNKDSGIFYFPAQKLSYTTSKISEDYTYRLLIHNTMTGNYVEARTVLIHKFDLNLPPRLPGVSILPGGFTEVNWTSAAGGKRYQLTVRIHYTETKKGDTVKSSHSLDWTPFGDIKSPDDQGGASLGDYINGDSFYTFLGSHIQVDPTLNRTLGLCDFIFWVASDDLDSYMQAEESSSLSQVKPTFSNITNGTGIFASRYVQLFENFHFTQTTRDSVKTNKKTMKLGF